MTVSIEIGRTATSPTYQRGLTVRFSERPRDAGLPTTYHSSIERYGTSSLIDERCFLINQRELNFVTSKLPTWPLKPLMSSISDGRG